MFIEILNNSFGKQPSLLPALDGLLESRDVVGVRRAGIVREVSQSQKRRSFAKFWASEKLLLRASGAKFA